MRQYTNDTTDQIYAQAELLRSLYRFGVIDYKTLDILLDELTFRLNKPLFS